MKSQLAVAPWILAIVIICAAINSTRLHAERVAALSSDGRIYASNPNDFDKSKSLFGVLPCPSLQTYVDVTFGDDRIYGLRSDGAVYYCDQTGSSIQALTNWTKAVTKITFSNGNLYGLSVSNEASNILDERGQVKMSAHGLKATDFGALSDDQFALLISGDKTWVYIFHSNYKGSTQGRSGFINYAMQGGAVAFDVRNTLVTVLCRKELATWWKFCDGIKEDSVFACSNIPQAISVSLTEDCKTAYFLCTDAGGMTLRKAAVQASSMPSFLGSFVSLPKDVRAVGVVIIPDAKP